MTSPEVNPACGCVTTWHAHTSTVWRDEAAARRALEWLTPAERDRYERYRFEPDRRMFLLGRVMARALVGRALGVAPTAWRWAEGARGRPDIAEPATGLSFNLAHSAGLVVCALSRDGAVGIDIENRARRPVDVDLVRRFCAPAEVADIGAQPAARWHDQFLKYWTLKEAYLKARGLGIAVHLADIAFSLGPRITIEFLHSLVGTDPHWAFDLTELGDDHFVAVAAPVAGAAPPTFQIAAMPLDLLPPRS